ncbi:AGAP008500-PA [Anopheles gambiae str. PEST]|uniref:AGAP008500-PA n=1 Tax=Anopheles gambiae TaxID=7165 RepID=Q7Q4N6_ANOGA|nr:AGAP008500-PA [Anopheles gambiae str. PEST]
MDDETASSESVEQQQQQQPKTQEDILAARREARRRKILENSSNRLSKIVGQEIAPPPPKPEPKIAEESITSGDPFSSDSTSVPNGDIFHLLNTLNQAQPANGRLFDGAASTQRRAAGSQQQPSASSPSNSRFARALRTKVHLVVASIVAYLLFATGNEAYIGGNVFLPLLAWELIELLMIGSVEPVGGQQLLGIVFMLGGIPMKTSQTVMKLMNTVNKVMKDVAFFMFFFVLTHLLWSRLWLGIELRYVLGYDQLETVS